MRVPSPGREYRLLVPAVLLWLLCFGCGLYQEALHDSLRGRAISETLFHAGMLLLFPFALHVRRRGEWALGIRLLLACFVAYAVLTSWHFANGFALASHHARLVPVLAGLIA